MIRVAPGIWIDESEIREQFVRASGPGGQNVNKVSSAVQLRFDAAHSEALSGDVRARLAKLAGRRMTREGELVIDARRYRTQEANRRDAMQRLTALIARAAVAPKVRRATKPTRASRLRRLESKRRRSRIKQLRRPTGPEE